jgi:hypothetical protein
MFVAVVDLPLDPAALQNAATLCGLALVEVTVRCSGALPRVLVRHASEGEARRIVTGLEVLGFRAFAAEARQVPTDANRVVARALEWTDSGFAVTDARGVRHDCLFTTLELFQVGQRTTTHSEVITSTERKFSMGRAVMTGGLSFSKKVATVSTAVTSNRESFILVSRAEPEPAIILYEFRLNFQCLGDAIQHTRHGNLKAVLARLRTLAPVPVDERTTQMAFLRGLPQLGVDEVDLGLFLVRASLRPARP